MTLPAASDAPPPMTLPAASDAPSAAFPCERCGMVLFPKNLVCPNCGALVHSRRLNELAAQAQLAKAEGNLIRAAMLWKDCLPLLPPDSAQYRDISRRVGEVTSYLGPVPTAADGGPPPAQQNDSLPLALAKTLGSMFLSFLVYAWLFSERNGLDFAVKFSVGLLLLILVHELGHSFAMRYYGLSASPPFFIPFLGAAVRFRDLPRNVLEEAVVGIAGPVAGTVASALVYAAAQQTDSALLFRLAEFGFLLNLLNMLPFPPLDGGRVAAAVSPWFWMPGLLALLGWIGRDYARYGQVNPVLILMLLMGAPRVYAVLKDRNHRRGDYYRIGRPASAAMGAAYVILTVTLALLFYACELECRRRFGRGFFLS
jgi:Zn-dependent protease